MRLIAFLTLGIVTAAIANPVPYQGGTSVTFTPLPKVAAPSMKARYVGGYEAKGQGTSRLMGLSDLIVTPGKDGLMIDAVSDYGDHVRMIMPANGRAGPLSIDALKGADGKPFGNKTLSDSEDMALDPMTGDHYVSFEGDARVLLYSTETGGLSGKGERLPLDGLPLLPGNQGLEAVTFVREFPGETSLILGAEAGGFWRCRLEDYKCTTLVGPTTPGFGYALVSIAPLDVDKPDQILALYRYYTPWSGARTVLRLLKLEGTRLTLVDTILEVKPPMPNDNYEGVSAVRKPGGGYSLYLISDPIGDNDPTRLLVFDYK
ncbi:esterase-like activity of phytase family protein [Asticcacaulis sp. BYS171W]|uniref:Esterase-like activity of phytase family protein n=1 Tax=Asticcacaulis aquaticus TaxID=2984212 RepID=A0ABT5HQY4_9CAUL|nr:esterase-like activity of phytase family protein [Asticcacaulis aquaticus]MDC7682235.1 esterase-like activity of phytase family protein [Asticcacaulis aquaticus]